jgi:hypothetical protein
MDDKLRLAALRFVNGMIAQAEIQELDDAVGWVVSCRDPETGRQTLFGMFDGPAEALASAERFSVEVNRGASDGPPWELTALPVIGKGGPEQ